MAEQSEYRKIREPMRSAEEASNCMAQREKAETVFNRQARECRDRARALLNTAETLEKMAFLASKVTPDQESYLFELAIRSNPAFN